MKIMRILLTVVILIFIALVGTFATIELLSEIKDLDTRILLFLLFAAGVSFSLFLDDLIRLLRGFDVEISKFSRNQPLRK